MGRPPQAPREGDAVPVIEKMGALDWLRVWWRLFHGVKSDITGFLREFRAKGWKMGTAGITTPHPWSFSPLRGEGNRDGSREMVPWFLVSAKVVSWCKK